MPQAPCLWLYAPCWHLQSASKQAQCARSVFVHRADPSRAKVSNGAALRPICQSAPNAAQCICFEMARR